MITSKTIKEASIFFGKNALIGKERGLSVQDVANINKETAIVFFGMSEKQSEILVEYWVRECQKLGVIGDSILS